MQCGSRVMRATCSSVCIKGRKGTCTHTDVIRQRKSLALAQMPLILCRLRRVGRSQHSSIWK